MILLKCVLGELAPYVVLETKMMPNDATVYLNNVAVGVTGSQCPLVMFPEFGISHYHSRP